MSIMSFFSVTPLRRSNVRVGGALRRSRDFKLSVRPDGLDVGYTTQTGFDLDLTAGNAIDFHGEIAPQLAAQVATGRNEHNFLVIDVQPQEAERFLRPIAKATPNGEPLMPIIDGYAPRNGVLVPLALVRQHLTQLKPQPEKGLAMSHPLQRSAPVAYDLIKRIVDAPDSPFAEINLFEAAREQGICKRIDHIKGTKPLRAKTLSDADVDAVVDTYAKRIIPRDISKIDEAQITALPDGTVGIVPLFGQRNNANVFLLMCAIAHGNPGTMRLALEIDEVLPAISGAVLAGLGRKPKDEAAE